MAFNHAKHSADFIWRVVHVNGLVGIGKNNVGKFAFDFPERTRLR